MSDLLQQAVASGQVSAAQPATSNESGFLGHLKWANSALNLVSNKLRATGSQDTDTQMINLAAAKHSIDTAIKIAQSAQPIGEEVTDAEIEILAREMERHKTLCYEWTPKQFDVWWKADVFCKRDDMKSMARAGLTYLAATSTKPAQEPLQAAKDAPDDVRMLLIHSLVASKGWNHGYAAAFVDDWFHARFAAIASQKGAAA